MKTFVRKCLTGFQSDYHFAFHLQWMRVLVAPHSSQYVLLSVWERRRSVSVLWLHLCFWWTYILGLRTFPGPLSPIILLSGGPGCCGGDGAEHFPSLDRLGSDKNLSRSVYCINSFSWRQTSLRRTECSCAFQNNSFFPPLSPRWKH